MTLSANAQALLLAWQALPGPRALNEVKDMIYAHAGLELSSSEVGNALRQLCAEGLAQRSMDYRRHRFEWWPMEAGLAFRVPII